MRWAAGLAALAAAGCLDAPPAALDPGGDGDGDGSSPDAGGGDPEPPVLLAAYLFDQPNLLADTSGNGHDARCAGAMCPDWVLDRENLEEAARFDGATQYLVADALGEGAFTAMIWLRMDDDADGGLACPLNRPIGSAGLNSWQLCLQMAGGGDGQAYFYTAQDPYELAAGVPLTIDVWYHVAIRWDGSTKAMWWDGVEVASGAGKTGFDQSEIHLGTDLDGEALIAWFPGALDQLELWQGALSDDEIRAAATGE
jgi:hypothetical protein